MSSLRQIYAARANGALSQGPVTPEGRRRSSQNALKHGLLSRRVVLESESPEDFQTLLDQHTAHLSPVDDVEVGFIEEMASSSWRLRRLWAIETSVMDEALAAEPEGDDFSRTAAAFQKLAASPALGLIHRYETRLHTMYQRSLRNMLVTRAASKPEEPATPSVVAVRWVEPAGNPGEPAPANDVPPEPNHPSEGCPVCADDQSQPDAPTSGAAAIPNKPSPISGQSPEEPPCPTLPCSHKTTPDNPGNTPPPNALLSDDGLPQGRGVPLTHP